MRDSSTQLQLKGSYLVYRGCYQALHLAERAIFKGLGPLVYILLGFRERLLRDLPACRRIAGLGFSVVGFRGDCSASKLVAGVLMVVVNHICLSCYSGSSMSFLMAGPC